MKTNLIKTELTLAQILIINLIGAINLMPKTWITFALLFIYPNWKLTKKTINL